jgi:hypothetical protein
VFANGYIGGAVTLDGDVLWGTDGGATGGVVREHYDDGTWYGSFAVNIKGRYDSYWRVSPALSRVITVSPCGGRNGGIDENRQPYFQNQYSMFRTVDGVCYPLVFEGLNGTDGIGGVNGSWGGVRNPVYAHLRTSLNSRHGYVRYWNANAKSWNANRVDLLAFSLGLLTLTAQTDGTAVDLSWTGGSGTVVIRRSSAPGVDSADTQAYSGTGSSCTDAPGGGTWYYKAFAGTAESNEVEVTFAGVSCSPLAGGVVNSRRIVRSAA